MKKILIFLFIAIGFITFFGYLVNENDGSNLLKKLDKFEKIENLYYESQFDFKLMGMQDVEMIIKQYKNGNNYNAKKISPLSKTSVNLKVENGILSFEQSGVIVEGSVEESKADRSLFWLDKLSSKDILSDSIKKIKTPKDFEAGKCDMYSARLKETMSNFDICINKDNIPVYAKYYNMKNFIPLLFDTNPITNLTKNSGDVIVKVADIRFNPEYDSSFDMPEQSDPDKIMNVKDVKRIFERQKSQYDKLNKSVKMWKNQNVEWNNDDDE